MSAFRNERGGILVLSAVLIPVFLLMTALIVDGGNWFTHKRQLQNRADAGALAAGVEYLSQLQNCVTSPGSTGITIADVAKRYAGTEETITDPGPKYNQQIAKQSELTVVINDSTDGSDNPCTNHPVTTPPDSISPKGGYWTDVKVRETNIGTLFGGFGLNLPSVSAQARVEVNQITGIKSGGLPFVAETGDQIECVWARFVRAADPSDLVTLTGGQSNPVLLDAAGPGNWEKTIDGVDIAGPDDDVAVEYWLGSKTFAGACDFSTARKGVLPDDGTEPPPAYDVGDSRTAPFLGGIDWLNVYDDDFPGAYAPPELHHFIISPGTCGQQVTFIYAAAPCSVTLSAEVVPGPPGPSPNVAPTSITVSSSNPAVPPVTLTNAGGNYWIGTMTFDPLEVAVVTPARSQNFTQVGQHRLTVEWEKTTGRIGGPPPAGTACTVVAPCTGTFESEHPGDVQHAIYVADPLHSNPITFAELVDPSSGDPIQNSWAGGGPATGSFRIEFSELGIDQQNTVLIRESVQGSGNRTFTINCGQGTGANALRDAIRDGCPEPVAVNTRAMPPDPCNPFPTILPPNWDCVETVPGNRSSTVAGYELRFNCSMPNNWDGGSPDNLSSADRRYAYIFLTGWGQIANVNPGTWLPIRGFLRVYVTGWDTSGPPGSYEQCGGDNEPPPRGYDGAGAQLWGHFVEVITLEDDVIVSDEPCDLNPSLITCKPQLVR